MSDKSDGWGKELDRWRVEIDDCDRQIIELLARRFELVRRIGVYKANHGIPILDEAREAELLSDRKRKASLRSNYPVEDIFKLILEHSRQVQAKLKKDIEGKCQD